MTNEELKAGIDALRFTMEMFLYDPGTGQTKEASELNELDKITYDGCIAGVTALEKAEKYSWHDLRKNPDDLPDAEKEVDVVCIRGNRKIRTHGFYENGKVHTEDSDWFWDEISGYGTYCEETDDYIIPEGWWEYRHYNPDGVYNNIIDDKVIAWREIDFYEEDEE